ncbi:Alpha/Beta hydrolase protein [Apiospora phragmitis]|uniref:Alpha/Beta hydrolase protein n=1 Tax=Apiospora phragmitis TaxID=2905665 RepID=A0ABR1VZL8_9PEZI
MAGPSQNADEDPKLLRDHSEVKSFITSRFTYPEIRVFYRQHPKADELPSEPAPLPLLVFLHGLGGSVKQFHPLLSSLTNNASCLAVDLPGCGRSGFAPKSWEAYSMPALAELLELIIERYRGRARGQGVVLIAHSMGSALAARLANTYGPHRSLSHHVLGVVGICPVAGEPKNVKTLRRLLWVPTWAFNLYRMWDQWGGPYSASVTRFVGPEADLPSRELQYRFNRQSRTSVFRRVAWGLLPTYVNGESVGGLFGEPTWAGLNVPVFLIGGESDHVISPAAVVKIVKALEEGDASTPAASTSFPGFTESLPPTTATTSQPAQPLPKSISAITDKDFERRREQLGAGEETYEESSTPRDDAQTAVPAVPELPLPPRKVVKTIILPRPAGHSLFFTPKTVRTVSGLICNFLSENITGRFDLGWQLQYLSREGKWDVKNLAKWKKVEPVSKPICGIFRAMKTLREVDEDHSPRVFVPKYGNLIKDIIDISHDNPVYDALGLEKHGIKYHKFATVSKIPPTDDEVATFVGMVDRVREDQKARAEVEGWKEYAIGVHCHYGFNRTGYFIVCYLVDRLGMDVQEAIDTFAEARPNGIRHSHFLDRLFLRYYDMNKP